MWVDAASQPTFSAALGIDPSDAPTVALLSPRRLRVARLTTRFTRDAVSQLIDRVLNAQVATAPLGVLPVLVEGGEAAAGSGEEAVEEEFDLSEIMGEAVDELDDRTARLEAVRLTRCVIRATHCLWQASRGLGSGFLDACPWRD